MGFDPWLGVRWLVIGSAWIGTALVGAAPFLIDTAGGKVMAIVGLAMLCLQAIEKKCYNLVILNIIGIIGYASHFHI
tara:strand:+ start:354 stop:584 length:231 start_codon:yes stop_codon:yes gene_type:complete